MRRSFRLSVPPAARGPCGVRVRGAANCRRPSTTSILLRSPDARPPLLLGEPPATSYRSEFVRTADAAFLGRRIPGSPPGEAAARSPKRKNTTGQDTKKIRKTLILRILPTGIAGFGGEGGIRTPGTVARTPHFECGPIDHSGTSPFSFAPQPAKPSGAGIRAKPARGSFRSANIGIIFSLPHIRDKNFARNDIFSPKPQIIPIFGRDCKTLPATASHVPVARNDRRIRKRVRFSLSE